MSCCAACLAAVSLAAQAPAVSEHEIKAAFVYNLAKYVDWPAETLPAPESPILLCVVGKDRFGNAFSAIDGRKAQGRDVRVRRGLAPEEIRGCHIAFVSDSEARRVGAVLAQASGVPALTVSDIEGFAEAGGAVGLVSTDQRVQFEVNLHSVQAANLKLSSQVLKLARVVYGFKGR
jgi:hypothetical protein